MNVRTLPHTALEFRGSIRDERTLMYMMHDSLFFLLSIPDCISINVPLFVLSSPKRNTYLPWFLRSVCLPHNGRYRMVFT